MLCHKRLQRETWGRLNITKYSLLSFQECHHNHRRRRRSRSVILHNDTSTMGIALFLYILTETAQDYTLFCTHDPAYSKREIFFFLSESCISPSKGAQSQAQQGLLSPLFLPMPRSNFPLSTFFISGGGFAKVASLASLSWLMSLLVWWASLGLVMSAIALLVAGSFCSLEVNGLERN